LLKESRQWSDMDRAGVGEEAVIEAGFRLTVNGAERSVTCEPDTPLLDVLRDDLGLSGPRFGSGMGLCGACLVLIGDRARSSCDLPVSAVDGPADAAGAGRPAGQLDGRLTERGAEL
jgi:hypothetical protein